MVNKDNHFDPLTEKIIDLLQENPLRTKEICYKLFHEERCSEKNTRKIERTLKKLINQKIIRKINKDEIAKWGLETDGRYWYYIINFDSYALSNNLENLFEKFKDIYYPLERNIYTSLLLEKKKIFGYEFSLNEIVKYLLEIWNVDLVESLFDSAKEFIRYHLPRDQLNYDDLFIILSERATIYQEYRELSALFNLLYNNLYKSKEKGYLTSDVKENLIKYIRKRLKLHVANLNKFFNDKLRNMDTDILNVEIAIKNDKRYSLITERSRFSLTISVILECLKILVVIEENIVQDLKEIFNIIFEEKNLILAEDFFDYINDEKPEILRSSFKYFVPTILNKMNVNEIFPLDLGAVFTFNEFLNWVQSSNSDNNEKN